MGFVAWFKGTYLFTHLNVGKYTKRRSKTFRRSSRKSEADMIQRYLESGLAPSQYRAALPHHPDPRWEANDPDDGFFDVQLVEAPRRPLTAPPNSIFLTDAYRTSTSLASLSHLIRTQ